jgi:hypothetical protein
VEEASLEDLVKEAEGELEVVRKATEYGGRRTKMPREVRMVVICR